MPDTHTPPLEELLAGLAARDLTRASTDRILDSLSTMIEHADYPCVGAKSVFHREGVVHLVLDDLASPDAAPQLLRALRDFSAALATDPGFHSFIVSFRRPQAVDERTFEGLLWRLLQRLHDEDPEPWAAGVSADPANPHFAFSVAGTAYFVVGLHPTASRIARRAPLPTLVFNPHDQFEELRRSGRFDRMRETIRRRDSQLQGAPNPMVADHGEMSEAVQYSGRPHDREWVVPLDVHRPEVQEDPE